MGFDLKKYTCPRPLTQPDTVTLAHGSGGRLSAELVRRVFLPRFSNPLLNALEDQAVFDSPGSRLAFTTDAFVVDPLFFPGGNIGDLAVNGTVNDLAMSGAVPLYLSAAFILEEGFPLADLELIADAMSTAASLAGVQIVTGDTKVVNRGGCDRIFITTAGVGVLADGIRPAAVNLQPGDKILVSGTIGDHGMAIMSCREGLSFQSRIRSDCASLNRLVQAMLKECPHVRAMRDPTRGGLAATLNEWAGASDRGIIIDDNAVPVSPDVRGACEILGIDPIYVANEGKLVAAVPAEEARKVLAVMHSHPLGKDSAIIGEVVAANPRIVVMRTALGTTRIIDMPSGDQLPRIC